MYTNDDYQAIVDGRKASKNFESILEQQNEIINMNSSSMLNKRSRKASMKNNDEI